MPRYLAEFEREFRNFRRLVTEEEFCKKASEADLIYFGDQHDLRKVRQTVAEMVDQLVKFSARPPVLVTEFTRPSFLSAAAFRHQLLLCNLVRSKGLRRVSAGEDRALARRLADISRKHNDHPLWVQIGEAHLASGHLPQKAAARPELANRSAVRIFQNLPAVYFAALKKFPGFRLPKILLLKEGVYHLQTAPLLTKFIADVEYALIDSREETDLSQFWTEELGVKIVSQMCYFLGFKRPNDSQLLYFCFEEETEGWQWQERGCVFLPETSELLIRRFRLKYILEEIAKFVWQIQGRSARQNFLEKNLGGSKKYNPGFPFFCSKLFIPERRAQNGVEERGEKLFQRFMRGGKDAGRPRVA